MVLNATFNYISVISWRSVLLVWWRKQEKTRDLSQVTDKSVLYDVIDVNTLFMKKMKEERNYDMKVMINYSSNIIKTSSHL